MLVKLFVIPFILLHSFIYNFMGTFVVKLLCILFLAVPAVSTKLAAVDSDRFDHIIETVKTQGSKVQLYSDPLYHLLILRRIRIGICT